MKPEAWAALKALQRANKKRAWHGSAFVDQRRAQIGMQSMFGMSRKPARKAREKGK